MDQLSQRLRQIPSITQLLELPEAIELASAHSPALLTDALRRVTEQIRERLLAGEELVPDASQIIMMAKGVLEKSRRMDQRPVINSTGILLHTNLGRAPMAEIAGEAARQAAIHYTNLEYDDATGKRGDRLSPIIALLQEITGAEDALVVNNNAAAMLLCLSALAKGHEVVVSRGELVEIGGSFRVPEVMAQSGCVLREVGATNKTRLSDYEKAIGEDTAALMKVHCSNFQILGFTQSVSLPELAELAHQRGLPLLHDLGSGALLGLSSFGLSDEPGVRESLQDGADVVCFSGDKLLGGPQAGIILGKARYINQMKKHPLMRALRADKMTLAALEATLMLYRDQALAMKHIPLYQMLAEDEACLTQRGEALIRRLSEPLQRICRLVPSQAQVGGGSSPGEMLPSVALALRPTHMALNQLYMRLVQWETPVIARIHQDSLLLDMRTVRDHDLPLLAEALEHVLREGGQA